MLSGAFGEVNGPKADICLYESLLSLACAGNNPKRRPNVLPGMLIEAVLTQVAWLRNSRSLLEDRNMKTCVVCSLAAVLASSGANAAVVYSAEFNGATTEG